LAGIVVISVITPPRRSYAIGAVCLSVSPSVVLSVSRITAKVYSSDFIETWYCDWAYQWEELNNFWWWYGAGYGFRITFPLRSPLRKRRF